MLNPDFSIFNDNMFVQVRQLLDPLVPPDGLAVLDLTVGEPKFPPPDWLSSELAAASTNWQAYPKAFADQAFLDDLGHYFDARFGSIAGRFDLGAHIVPVPGTREPLHLLGYCVKGAKADSIALVTNPFYHAWRAGALASGGAIDYVNASEQTGFLADLDSLSAAQLDRCTVLYLCNPSNPQGVIADAAYIEKAVTLARQHNFLLIMDECYIDIWRRRRPVSALEVAWQMNSPTEDKFSHLIIINSLSKRSSAAGLRAGFLCGDKRVIAAYKQLVANGAALVPTPLLHVAGALYRDAAHNQTIRSFYDSAFEILSRHLPVAIPQGGFFLWYPVPSGFTGDDRAFSASLYEKAGIRTVAGSFMAKPHQGINPGAGFVRLAIVHEHPVIEQAASRIASFVDAL